MRVLAALTVLLGGQVETLRGTARLLEVMTAEVRTPLA